MQISHQKRTVTVRRQKRTRLPITLWFAIQRNEKQDGQQQQNCTRGRI